MLRVLVTGATGFIGTQLVNNLHADGFVVRAAVRHLPTSQLTGIEYFVCGEIDADTDWGKGLQAVDAIVHLAGRVHVMDQQAAQDAVKFRQANVAATLCLIQAAIKSSIKRFIYMSSIKVNGESSGVNAFTAGDIPAPEDAYACSKLAAEQALFDFSKTNDIDLVVIRPPLVYGPNAKGNFATLLNSVKRGLPLPLKCIRNSRSLVSVFNLCDLVKVCITHPSAGGEVFLVSDGQDVSTPQLIRLIAQAMHRQARLLFFPVCLLRFIALLTGKREMMRRLCGNLQVDIGKTYRLLGWKPALSVEQGLLRSIGSKSATQ